MARSKSSKGRREELLEALGNAARESSTVTVLFHQAIADQLGLNATDHKCLGILLGTGPVTAGQLAEATGLTTGAITGIIDRLEAAELVRRERDPNDRRRVIIQPTVSSERAREIGELFEPMRRGMFEVAAAYSDDELALVLDFFTRCTEMARVATSRLRGRDAVESTERSGTKRTR